jgi:hypothetical protein
MPNDDVGGTSYEDDEIDEHERRETIVEGIYREALASLSRSLAQAKDEPTRQHVFENAVDEVINKWHGLDRSDAFAALQDIADARGFDTNWTQNVFAEAVAREPQPKPNGNGHAQHAYGDAEYPPHTDTPKTGPIDATLYVLPDPLSIPPRPWLYERHYIRGSVTSTVAPGGFGKTSLGLFEAINMAKRGLAIWYISGEDDRVELDRRIAAFQELYPEDFPTRFFLDDKMTFPFKIARQSNKSGPVFDEERMRNFEGIIAARELDVVMLDPFISFHYLSESDTTAMDVLIKRLGEICFRRQCCIELSHHVRKPNTNQTEITVYDARGAGAIVNAVRSCRVINQMSIVEAAACAIDLDKRSRYIRVDSGKRNMAPSERAKWYRLSSIEIANGDNVQAIEAWEFKPQTPTDADTEWLKVILTAREYAADPRSDEWIGIPICEHFGRALGETKDEKRASAIFVNKQLRKWMDDHLIEKQSRYNAETRKDRTYIVLKNKPTFTTTTQATTESEAADD